MSESTLTNSGHSSRALSIGLWVIQVVLAFIFLAHGLMMLMPPAELVDLINEQLGIALRIFIGVAEVAAVAGLLGPGITKLLPFVTPLTGLCLTVLMACATATHVSRGEYSSAITCIIIGVLAAFLAYARLKLLPIRGRS